MKQPPFFIIYIFAFIAVAAWFFILAKFAQRLGVNDPAIIAAICGAVSLLVCSVFYIMAAGSAREKNNTTRIYNK